MADEAERRREFAARAPELRAAAVLELLELTARASDLSADEAEVLRHVAARAGYAYDGFHIPELAALWGEAGDSYFPPVPLPMERARQAAQFLRRRGVLRPEGGGVFVVIASLAPLAAPVAPIAGAKRPKKKPASKKTSKRAK
ncbi:MAG TPA: hypothetical protein VN915_09465 [Elusimicrobiota bacterium]|nr:hypothetical protein [Elusimicrobiota bacterium]